MTTLVQSSNLADTIAVNNFIVASVSANGTTGIAGQILRTDGANVYWSSATPPAAGINSSVQYNNLGVISGESTFTYEQATDTLTTQNTVIQNTLFVNKISANGIVGSPNRVLTANSTGGTYWGPAATGVTQITTTSDLTGGPITATGQLALSTTGVTPGTYGTTQSIPTFTVDSRGRLTFAGSTTLSWNAITQDKPASVSGYGITDAVSTSRVLNAADSIIGGGDLSTNRTFRLSGDVAAPGNSKYYGTNSTGIKGFYDLPGMTSIVSTDNAITRFNGTTGDIQNSGVLIDDLRNVTGANNLTISGSFVAAGNTTIGTNALVVDSISKKVGIGTTTPVSSLDLVGNFASTTTTLTSGTINCSLGNYFKITITAATTFAFNTVPTGKAYSLVLEIINGGSQNITWPANISWPNGIPALSASGRELVTLVTQDGGTNWCGEVAFSKQSSGMVLLGTLPLTSGSSLTLNSLSLTQYKSLYCVINNVNIGGSGRRITVGGADITTNSGTGNANAAAFYIDLLTSLLFGSVRTDTTVKNINGLATLTNASISVPITTSGTFSAGSMIIYGVV